VLYQSIVSYGGVVIFFVIAYIFISSVTFMIDHIANNWFHC